jgi:NSS family neurotransmitter:Na+ symporter
LALPVATVNLGTFFDEFDYWAGTFSLVVFAAIEVILFAWVFGMDRGWDEMKKGAEIQIPGIFYYIIKFVTPAFLLTILLAYAFQPKAGWDAYLGALFTGQAWPAWEWDGNGMIGKLLFVDLPIPNEAAPEQKTFLQNMRIGRAIDRLVMIGLFAFFGGLVWVAWNRRRAEGRE